MSHFSVFVLCPENPVNRSEDYAQEYVERKLAFYDENLQVPEYPKSCYCVGQAARVEVMQKVNEQLGSIDTVREQFWRDVKTACEMPEPAHGAPRDQMKAYREEMDKAEEAVRPTWAERIQPRIDLEKQLEEGHPLIKTPDAECDSCSGTGTYASTYNPNSKWDWWVIGGRWNGYLLPAYDPVKDPRNLEKCWLCGGSGKRDDALGRAERERNPSYTCNGCDGNGQSVVFASKYAPPPEGGNIAPVASILDNVKNGHNVTPFAFVLPSGEWVEKGKMGWWAMVADEKSDWKDIARGVLDKYRDHWAIVVDCHI